MDHVALRIQQNVAIVSVFDLQDVAKERVAGGRLEEVVASFCVAFAGDPRLELLLWTQLLDTFGHLVGEPHIATLPRSVATVRRSVVLVSGLEVLLQRGKLRARLLQLVNRDGIWNGLN